MNNIAFKQLELETLLEITNTLIEHEDVDDLLHDILIRTCGILDASCGFVLIEEKNSDLFVPKAVFNLDEKVLSKIIFNKKREKERQAGGHSGRQALRQKYRQSLG